MTDEVSLPARVQPGATVDDLIRLVGQLQDYIEAREPNAFGGKLNKFIPYSEAVRTGLLTMLAGGSAVGPGGDSFVPGPVTSSPIDATPPTPASGLAVAQGVSHCLIQIDAPTYTQGGGNGRTVIYRANYSGSGPLPTFGDAVEVGAIPGRGVLLVVASEPGVQGHYWAKAETRYPTLQATPTGGINGVTATAELIENQHVLNLSAAKLIAGAIGVSEYVESTGFTSGSAGWRISGDGNGEVNNWVVRGTVYATAGSLRGLNILAADGSTIISAGASAAASTFAGDVTGLVGGSSAVTIALAATNFNAANDRSGAAITAPTIAGDLTAVDHTLRADGSADISFEWAWAGDEGDIDGFQVYARQGSTATPYSFGTTPSDEVVFEVPAAKRAFILFGVPADAYYTFGVRAYRRVDKDIAASGLVVSTLVKDTVTGENPYQPSATVAFEGNVTGTISGTPASTLVATAANAAADATQALSDAADANQLLINIASDSKLTPVEKQAIRSQWDAIYAERADIRAKADAMGGVATEKTGYDNAFEDLGDYLNGGTAYTIGTTRPLWIRDATELANTTTISGDVFRATWATLYTARQALLNKIAEIAATKANWASISSRPADAELLNTQAAFQAEVSWSFIGGADGWTWAGMSSVASNAATFTLVSGGTDPSFFSPAISINGPAFTKVRVRLRRLSGDLPAGFDCYYKTNGFVSGWTGLYYKNIVPPASMEVGAWVVVEFDMSDLTAGNGGGAGYEWKSSTITQIRLDFGAANGDTYEIDWIAIGNNAPGSYGAPPGSPVGNTTADIVAGAAAAVNDGTTGLSQRLRSNAQNVLAGAGGLATGTLTWDSGGNRTGGFGIGFTQNGIVAYNAAFAQTFVLNGSTGEATFAGVLSAAYGTLGGLEITNGGHVRSGQSAYNTGTGFWIGQVSGVPKMSVGSATKGFTWDGTDFTILGDLVASNNLALGAVNKVVNAQTASAITHAGPSYGIPDPVTPGETVSTAVSLPSFDVPASSAVLVSFLWDYSQYGPSGSQVFIRIRRAVSGGSSTVIYTARRATTGTGSVGGQLPVGAQFVDQGALGLCTYSIEIQQLDFMDRVVMNYAELTAILFKRAS